MEIILLRYNLQKTWLDLDMTLKAWNVYLPFFVYESIDFMIFLKSLNMISLSSIFKLLYWMSLNMF